MTTGNSYLIQEDLRRNLGMRHRLDDVRLTVDLPAEYDDAAMKPTAERPRERDGRPSHALPLRGLDPDVLEDVDDDACDYAARCLASSSLDTLFDGVIATAEMRAGRDVVRDVLVALASARDGRTVAELAADDADRVVSITHVLAILGNHVHRVCNRYRLTPVLHAAVERRYPLGSPSTRTGTLQHVFVPGRRVAAARRDAA